MPKSKIQISQHEPSFDEREAQAVYRYMKSGGWLMEFKKTEELERKLADFTGAKHVVMVPNATIALTMTLIALGLKRGDEVLVPDLTMIATPNAAALIGVRPVFVDVEPETLCMSTRDARGRIGKKTRAMIYVSLHGRSGDMRAVKRFCKRHNLLLIEDAAQSLGSFWQGQHLGTFGDVGVLSFSVPKIITTGQGGALLTNDTKLYRQLLKLKNFGRESGGADVHDAMGWNFKFTDLQAVVGLEQIKKLPARVKRKKAIWRRYERGLRGAVDTLPTCSTPWFIDIYVDDPDELAAHLKKLGIGTRRIYPAVHAQKIYKTRGRFPVSERAAARGLWLPSSAHLTNAEIDYVVKTITERYARK